MRELSVAEQRYVAVLSVIADGLSVSQVVEKADQRIRISATLTDGDRIRICGHEFTFEICGS